MAELRDKLMQTEEQGDHVKSRIDNRTETEIIGDKNESQTNKERSSSFETVTVSVTRLTKLEVTVPSSDD